MSRLQSWLFLVAVAGLSAICAALGSGCHPDPAFGLLPLGDQQPVLEIFKSHGGNFRPGEIGATYVIEVLNRGLPTRGTVTVVDTLPMGLTATGMVGAGWSCTLATLTCTRGDSLRTGGVYPTINLAVNVAANAPASVTNMAVVFGGGSFKATFSDQTTIAGPPVITQVMPGSGQQGATIASVTISGQFTNFVQGMSEVSFSGRGITPSNVMVTSATSLTVTLAIAVNAPLGPQTVTVTTGGKVVSLTNGFTVTAPTPVITQVMPSSGLQGAMNLSVMITGQFTHFAQGTSVVSFSGTGITPSNVMVADATSLTVTLTIAANAPLGPQTVTVTTGAERASLTNGFTVTAPTPVITQVMPSSGLQGAMNLNVMITGQFTNFVQGTSVVSFSSTGITPSNVMVASATGLTATLTIGASAPLGPQTVTVTTGAEVASLANGFTIIAAPTACPLNGQYAFLFNGFDGMGYVAIAGSFTVNASGNVTTGVEDVSRSGSVTANQAFTGGSCTMVSSNQGTLTLITASATTLYHFTVETQSATQRGNFIEFDDASGTGTQGSGSFQLQDTNSFSLARLAGEIIVGLSGNNTAFLGRVVAVGRFTLDAAGMITNGELQVSTVAARSGALVLTGSFAAPDPTTGRGTATLMLPANSLVPSTLRFTYYIISGGSTSKVVLVQTDTRSMTVPTLSGLLRPQTGFGTFTAASLSGNIIFATEGLSVSTLINPSVTVGQMVADGAGNLTSGTLDQNAGGAITLNAPFVPGSGTYTVASNGRTDFIYQVSMPPVTVLMSKIAFLSGTLTEKGFIMDNFESDASFGDIAPQQMIPSGGFTAASLSGTFRVNSAAPTLHNSASSMFGNSGDQSGLGMLDGNGSLATSFSLTADTSDNMSPFLHSGVMSSGTYSVAPSGRALVAAALTSPPTLVCWIISPTDFVCISTVNMTPLDRNPILLEFFH